MTSSSTRLVERVGHYSISMFTTMFVSLLTQPRRKMSHTPVKWWREAGTNDTSTSFLHLDGR
jgi:hypothetical protein